MNKQYYYKARKNFISSTGVQFSYTDCIDSTAFSMLPKEEQRFFNKHELIGTIVNMNRALTRKHDPATKTDEFYKKVLDKSVESAHYKLMIYFAVATFFFYRKSIISNDKMSVTEFMEANKPVCDRVFYEGKELFNYEMSAQQMHDAIKNYMITKHNPQSIEDSADVYVIPS